MKSIINTITVVLFSWPALVVGYSAAAIKVGYSMGTYLHGEHEAAALDKYR